MKTTAFLLFSILMGQATAAFASYRVDGQIGKGQFSQISQVAVAADDTLFVLEKTGKLTHLNPDGAVIAIIDTGMANTEALAVAPNGNIYVLATLTQEKKVKVGARMRKIQVPIGVQCGVFDAVGTQLKTMELNTLKSARAARLIGDKLVVADLTARTLVFMDAASGEETGRIKKGLRLCCGIFDFCEGPGQTVAVSNLGAFKLQQFDLDGNLVLEFGKRGRGTDNFQGCCNPVSAGYLPDGRILTVEKDPTRIKIYDASGKNAQVIEGVEELVKGCEFIPVAIDSKGVIYLAANTKGYIVKCVQK